MQFQWLWAAQAVHEASRQVAMDFRELLGGEVPQFLLEPEISCLEIAEDDAGSVLSLCCESVHLSMASSSSDISGSDGMEFDLDEESRPVLDAGEDTLGITCEVASIHSESDTRCLDLDCESSTKPMVNVKNG